MRKWSEIRGNSIVAVGSAETLGSLTDMYLDAAGLHILAFRIKTPGLMGRHEAVLFADLTAIGGDAVTVQDAGKLNSPDNLASLQGSVRASDILGSRVMTENGVRVGSVGDFHLNLEGADVNAYLLGESLLGRFRGEEHPIPVASIRSLGKNLVVVSNEVATAGQTRNTEG